MNCTKKVAIVSAVACVLSVGSASGSGGSDTSGLFTATSASGSITVAVDDTTSNSGSGSVTFTDVNGVVSVNEDIDWASMAADDEWTTDSSNEIIEFGSVITPAVAAVAEVLATPDDVVIEGQVLVHGVLASDAVFAGPDDTIVFGQVITPAVDAVTEELAGLDDVVLLNQIITPARLAVMEELAGVLDVVAVDDVMTIAVEGTSAVLAGPNDVIVLGQILVDAVVAKDRVVALAVSGTVGTEDFIVEGQVLSKSITAKDAVLAGVDDVVAIGDILIPVVFSDAILAGPDDVIVLGQVMAMSVAKIDAEFATGSTLANALIPGIAGVDKVVAISRDIVVLGQVLTPSVAAVPTVYATADDAVAFGEITTAFVAAVTAIPAVPGIDAVPAVGDVGDMDYIAEVPAVLAVPAVTGVTGVAEVKAGLDDVIIEGQVLTPSVAAVDTVFAGPDDVVVVGQELSPAVAAVPASTVGDDGVIMQGQLLTRSVAKVETRIATEDDVVAVGDVLVAAVEAPVAEVLATADDVVIVGDVLVAGVTAADAVLATADDVVSVGDVLVAGVAAADAVLATADDVIVEGQLLAAATEGVAEVLAGPDDVVAVGDVLVAGVAAADAVLATQDDVDNSFLSVAGVSASAMKVAAHGLSEDEISGTIVDIANSGVLKSEVGLSKADKLMVISTGFAFASDPVLKTAYNTAMAEIASGATTVAAVRTKLNTDVGSIGAVASAGINSASSVIGGHQQNLVANSGKYGLNKYSLAILGDNGISSGSSALDSGYWLQVFGSDSNMGTRDGVAGYDANVHGVALGFDRKIGDDMMIGVAFNYSAIDVEGKSVANSQTDTDQYQGVIYGTMFGDNHFINGSVAYAHGASDTSRTTLAGGTASGSYDTGIFSASLGVGMPMDKATWSITPQVTAAYSHVNPDSYTENGPGALNVNPDSIDLFGIKAGVTINTRVDTGGGVFMPELRLVADWDVLQERAEVTSSWVSTGAVLATGSAPKPAALGAIIGTGVDYASDDGVYVLSMDYDLGVRPDFTSHSISGKIRVNF